MLHSPILSTPAADGFRMPAEWEPQQQIWMIWPERPDNWRLGGKPAQAAFCQVALAIAEYQPVSIGVSAAQYDNALARLSHANIRVLELSNDDAWMRDTGPTFVINDQGETRGIDWTFNAWGGLQGGLYWPWQRDDQVARKVLAIEHLPRYRTADFVLEGGAIHVDGEGTLLTTAECLLNSNRNPHLSPAEVGQYLRDYLNVSSIIWLPEGLYSDETDGHIDNFCCFARPGEVILAWTDDTSDHNYARCRSALAVLNSSTDAQGRKLKVHKMPLPSAIYATQDECVGVDIVLGSQARSPDIRLAGSYINFLIINCAIIAPSFNDPMDAIAKQMLQDIFPDRTVVMVPGREILLGGGNIHCITQQQPK